jgi:hypothetical protein
MIEAHAVDAGIEPVEQFHRKGLLSHTVVFKDGQAPASSGQSLLIRI